VGSIISNSTGCAKKKLILIIAIHSASYPCLLLQINSILGLSLGTFPNGFGKITKIEKDIANDENIYRWFKGSEKVGGTK